MQINTNSAEGLQLDKVSEQVSNVVKSKKGLFPPILTGSIAS